MTHHTMTNGTNTSLKNSQRMCEDADGISSIKESTIARDHSRLFEKYGLEKLDRNEQVHVVTNKKK